MKIVQKLDDKTLEVKFYFPANQRAEFDKALETVKSISGRRWHPATTSWRVPFTPDSLKILAQASFQIPEELQKMSDELVKEAEAEEKRIAEEIAKIKIKEKYLHDWQIDHCKKLIASVITNNASIDASDTGSGKTFSALQVAKYFNLRPIVLTKKRAIVQWERCMEVFGIKNFFVSNYEQYKFEKTEFLKKEKDEKDREILRWKVSEKDILIFDECFPYSTPVITDKGIFSIGEIVENNMKVKALSYNFYKHEWQYKKINHTFKKRLDKKIALIKTKQGEFSCTLNHKIWIEGKGYVKAENIKRTDRMWLVQKNDSAKSSLHKILFKKLQIKVFSFLARNEGKNKNELRKMEKNKTSKREFQMLFRKNEEKQSFLEKREFGKNKTNKNKKRNLGGLAWRAWRKWKIYKATVASFSSLKKTGRMGIRTGYSFGNENERFTNSLQGRYRKSKDEACNRGRWKRTQNIKNRRTGSEENIKTELIRVESIKILEPRNIKRCKEYCERDLFVYNIGVENNHNYVANNILVSNCHSAKNKDTINAKMLRASVSSPAKVHALSATLAENPMHLYSIGKVIGLFKDEQEYWRWCFAHGVTKGFWGIEFNATEENLFKIHHSLFPKYGSRIAIADLPKGTFPENFIVPNPISMGKEAEKKIQTLYDEMNNEISNLREIKSKDSGSSQLVAILRARQEIELLKVPIMVEMAKDYIEEGASVPIFVNFKETLRVLSEKLGTTCIIDGSTSFEKCVEHMDAFQADKERIILCNIASGGVAINLHDLNGKHNRVSIISPPQSAIQLVQTLGRIHRAGAKTPAVHRILYCANTVEEEIAEKLEGKIDNISKINDADLATAVELRERKEEDV